MGGMGLDIEKGEAGAVAETDIRLLAPLLRKLLKSRGLTVIRPKLSSNGNGKVIYPEADALFATRGAETERLIRLLESLGVLRKALIEVIKVCASCGSASLDFRERCPSCGKEVSTLYSARMGCPNCGYKLDGVEGVITCRKCGANFNPASCRELPLYVYILAEGGAEEGERRRVEGVGAEPLPAEMTRFIEEFGERLNLLLDQYIRAKPMYYVSNTTSVRKVGEVSKIELAPHLAKTYQVLRNKGRVTALEVSMETGRSRSLESVYLNQLVALGLASKQRVGRRLYFVLKEPGGSGAS
jgi:predicted RNA-binding Zn-ribbon protein involved in translation (DUF1610 family)